MEHFKNFYIIKSKKSLLTIISMILAVFSLTAQDAFFNKLNSERVVSDNTITWEQVSPGNAGFANLVRYHPTIPGKVSLCPDMWNAYQSDDNGTNWYCLKDYDGDGSFYHLRDLYYSPSDANFGLAITSAELWKTVDMGISWQLVKNCPWYTLDTDGTDKQSWLKKIASLAIDPNNKDVWYVGGGSNVRGQDWLSCYMDVTSANPRGKTALNEGKVWKTSNAGGSWTLINSGLDPKIQVGRIIVNPKNSNQVFAASNYGIYRSENGGATWSQISNGKLDNDIIMDMDFYYNETSGKFILYVIDQIHYMPDGSSTKCNGGIFCSSDEGDTWTKINGDIAIDINRLTGGVPNNYYKYIAAWLGIDQTSAKSTYPSLPTNALQYFNMISADPSREGAVYVGFADPQVGNSIMPGRLWTTSDNGQKWINTARLYEDAWGADKAYWESRGNPWHENMVVGHSSPHMRFGTDYALRSMRGLDVGVDGSVMIISDHSTMLSTDHGASWHQVDEDYTPSGAIIGHGNSNLPGLTIAQDLRYESTLLGSGEHRLWIPADDSPDERIAIKYIEGTQPTVSNIVYDPYDAKTVYVTSNRQENKQNIFKSTDGGVTWENYGVATPASNKWLDDFYTNGLLIDPINNKYMYLGITKIVDPTKNTQGGFFYSDDYGKTFNQSNTGLPSPARINDVKFDPRDKSMASLFAAGEKVTFNQESPISNGGLFHSADRGKTWTKVNTPASVEGVQFIEIDHTNRMYITTGYRGGGSGVWYTDDFGNNWTQIFKYPGTECINVSPFDNNLIVVTVKFLALNPGVFVSRDRGLTWTKSNKSIGIPHQIEDIKFDIHNAGEIWLATLGCGFYKGKIENGDKIKVVEALPNTAEIREDKPLQLSASIVNSDFTGESIIWKSENPEIATVDQTGLVTPVSRGLVKIWATTTDDRYSDFSVVTVDIKSGIADFKAYEPYIFPNPSKSIISIKNISKIDMAEITDMAGKTVKSFQKTNDIDISELETGIYLITAQNNSETFTFRFLKN